MSAHSRLKMVFTDEGTTLEIIEEVCRCLKANHDPKRETWTPGAFLVSPDSVDLYILGIGKLLNLGLLKYPDVALENIVSEIDVSKDEKIDKAFKQILRHILQSEEFRKM